MTPAVTALRRPEPVPGDLPVAARFRTAAGRFATGVTVVAAMRGRIARGMTANAFTTVSLDPPMLLVCLRRDGEMNRVLQWAGGFAVSVLADDQQAVAAHFADPARCSGVDEFRRLGWQRGPVSGGPLAPGALAWFDCLVAGCYDAGDHTVVLGNVERVHVESGRPLVFFASDYRDLSPEPALAANGSPARPTRGTR